MDIFPNRTNYHALTYIKLDCLSWYISDASFVIAHHISKFPIPDEELNTKAKDRGKHGIYEEMIQAWVTYEVIKVLYIYGLSPEPKDDIDGIAPDICKYYLYVIDGDDADVDELDEMQKLLMKKTLHGGSFDKCNFSGVDQVKWKADVKFMIPFLLLSWVRHLQQYFYDKKNTKKTWSKHGNYTPHLTLRHGESKNPLGLVFLSKVLGSKDDHYQVKKYNDIKPNEQETITVKDVKHDKVLFASFEEWAMFLLKPPLETRLTEAITANAETKRRWETCQAKLSSEYTFHFTETDYTNKKSKKKDKAIIATDHTTLVYKDKTEKQIHSVINQGLIKGQKIIEKLNEKKKRTPDERQMIATMETIRDAYIALAKKTLSQDVNTLNDINQHLKDNDEEGQLENQNKAARVNNGK